MKNISFVIIIFSFLVSCSKDKPITQPQNTTQPDNIFYHNFQPNITMHSVLYFIPNQDPESCGDYPVPSDTSTSFKINLDGDTTNDFIFNVATNPSSGAGGSFHCAHIVYTISISGIHAGDSISFTTKNYIQVPVYYDTVSNNVITKNELWRNNVMLSLSGQGVLLPGTASFGDAYIGVKIKNNVGWIHVAPIGLNGVIIKECAINLTPCNSIKAGQKN